MEHLTIRVAWHDSKWNGHICERPDCNSYCVALDRIRETRNDVAETEGAGKNWAEHSYAENTKAAVTHGNPKPTMVTVFPLYTMLKDNQDTIDAHTVDALPPDTEAPWKNLFISTEHPKTAKRIKGLI